MKKLRLPALTRRRLLAGGLGVVVLAAVGWVLPPVRAEVKALTYIPRTRTYYLAAENVPWDYAGGVRNTVTTQPIPLPYGAQTIYPKTRYIQYTDASFTKKVPQPVWLGILGPIIRGVPGDTIKVVFKNRASKPYTIHPHGLEYDLADEGSSNMTDMDDSSMAMPNMPGMAGVPPGQTANPGSAVLPGTTFTYTWRVRPEAGPGPHEGSSRVWLYHSHVTSDDIYDGVIGPIIITSAAHARADATPDDVDHEFVALFMIFDESKPGMTDAEHEGSLKHSINGRIFNTLPGLTMAQGDRVRWYLMDLGSEPDSHSPHWHGNVVTTELGHITDVVEMMPATMMTVDMRPDAIGDWLFHCHVADHMEAGMSALYHVVPRPNQWSVTFAWWWGGLLLAVAAGVGLRSKVHPRLWLVLWAVTGAVPIMVGEWRLWMTGAWLGVGLVAGAVWLLVSVRRKRA